MEDNKPRPMQVVGNSPRVWTVIDDETREVLSVHPTFRQAAEWMRKKMAEQKERRELEASNYQI